MSFKKVLRLFFDSVQFQIITFPLLFESLQNSSVLYSRVKIEDSPVQCTPVKTCGRVGARSIPTYNNSSGNDRGWGGSTSFDKIIARSDGGGVAGAGRERQRRPGINFNLSRTRSLAACSRCFADAENKMYFNEWENVTPPLLRERHTRRRPL